MTDRIETLEQALSEIERLKTENITLSTTLACVEKDAMTRSALDFETITRLREALTAEKGN